MSVEVICGDSLEVVPKLGKFDLVFSDPPFNIGQSYSGYSDNLPDVDFRLWLDLCVGVFWKATRGVLALHGPDKLAELYLPSCRKRKMSRISWINWHYRFGQCGRTTWIDARAHCLIYGRHGYTWNPESVLVESDRSSKYSDKRIHETENGGQRLPGTVWGIPSDGPYWGRVQGNNKERRGDHPNQLPEVYLERLILAYTNPGDRILDPFGGSGTTSVVADALGRDCVTIDISESSCESIRSRVESGAVRVSNSTVD